MPSSRGSSEPGIKPESLASPALVGSLLPAPFGNPSLLTGCTQIKITPSYYYVTSGMAKTSGTNFTTCSRDEDALKRCFEKA